MKNKEQRTRMKDEIHKNLDASAALPDDKCRDRRFDTYRTRTKIKELGITSING